LNPGYVGASQVTIDGELGGLAYSSTTYQEYLETEHAGRDADLGPFLPIMAERFTRAIARGSKKVLGS
jgi:hypothetical protein